MAEEANEGTRIAEDVRVLHRMGYAQELARQLGSFSNFAVSFSIICILAGGITSFHQGLCSVGGASIGLGWPLGCLYSLAVAAAMAQIASAFPTAGGLYHWASILGGRGLGWVTAWLNLLGLIFVLAAINVGTYRFLKGGFEPEFPVVFNKDVDGYLVQLAAVLLITFSQAFINHRGIRATAWLTDFSGYLILGMSLFFTAALLIYAPTRDWGRLVAFENFSGLPAGESPVWPRTENMLWLFALGLLLPAYTVTGFDASAHVSEETIGAALEAPRGMVRSVIVSGVFGWVMLAAIVLAGPSLAVAATQGDRAIFWIVNGALPRPLALGCYAAIGLAQYLCGLATVTSASRMVYAFARDGGLPGSRWLRRVSHSFRTPDAAIWTVAAAAVAFTVHTPSYDTIATAAALFLYVSYGVPIGLGLFAYGRSWKTMGPWDVGRWFRPLAVVTLVGCAGLIVIGSAPPNDISVWLLAGAVVLLSLVWFTWENKRFAGPPVGAAIEARQRDIQAIEQALGADA